MQEILDSNFDFFFFPSVFSEVKEYLPLCPFGSAERCLITARYVVSLFDIKV